MLTARCFVLYTHLISKEQGSEITHAAMRVGRLIYSCLLHAALVMIACHTDVNSAVTSLLDSACALFTVSGARIFSRSCDNEDFSCSLGPLLINTAPGLDVLGYFCNKTQSTSDTRLLEPTTTTTVQPTTTTPNFTTALDFYVFDRNTIVQLSRACQITNGLAGVVMQQACPRRQRCGRSEFQINLLGLDSTVSFCTNIASQIQNTILNRLRQLSINNR